MSIMWIDVLNNDRDRTWTTCFFVAPNAELIDLGEIQEWTARMCPTSGEDNTAKGHSKAAPGGSVSSVGLSAKRRPQTFSISWWFWQGKPMACDVFDPCPLQVLLVEIFSV